MRRDSNCTGLPDDVDLVFRSENAVAQRNSRRARGESSINRSISTYAADAQTEAVTAPSLPTTYPSYDDLKRWYPWLSARALAHPPEPLKRAIETRAVERVFVDWILFPRSDGLSPGYMHDFPKLYSEAEPGSVLWFAVRALAFADLKDAGAARRAYGSALNRLQRIATNDQEFSSNHVLAALLLIDNFEVTSYQASVVAVANDFVLTICHITVVPSQTK